MTCTPLRVNWELSLLSTGGRSGRALTGSESLRNVTSDLATMSPAPQSFSRPPERLKRARFMPMHTVVDLSGPPANVPEGFRFVDVQRLSSFVETNATCNRCQRGIIKAQLASFVSELKDSGSFSTSRGIDQALRNYTLPPVRLPKTRLKLKREEVSGFSSILTFACSDGHEIDFETSNSVITGKLDRGRTPEINLRLALAFLNLGKQGCNSPVPNGCAPQHEHSHLVP
jgi:hypothetical protein